jgi:integrase
VIATAAFTGARRGEIRGMFWENYCNGAIQISRSVWNGYVTDPKSAKSKGAIPIISRLASKLNAYRARQGNPISGPMFPNDAGKPMDLNNLLNRVILPALDVCAVCRRSISDHTKDHDFKRDPLVPCWHGWHAFRRGLGTNLHRLGVPDKTIQAILRHANVSTTQTFYIKSISEDAVAAMEKLNLAVFSAMQAEGPTCPKAISEAIGFTASFAAAEGQTAGRCPGSAREGKSAVRQLARSAGWHRAEQS